MSDLKNFQLPDELAPSTKKSHPLFTKIINFCENFLGMKTKITPFLRRFHAHASGDEHIDTLNQIKHDRLASDRVNFSFTLMLILMLVLGWRWGLPMLAEADQLKNDLKEQAQVISMEKSNQKALERLSNNQQVLSENIQKVYSALPKADEKSEAVISMLEDMAANNRMMIDAIGIRQIPESQLYYNDLIGVVEAYEYTFTLEAELPNLLSFIASVRSSLRLMDLMAMEIEEKDGRYRAGFVLNAYHLSPDSIPNEAPPSVF